MTQTAVGLRRLGADVQMATIGGEPLLADFDLVHIFNWQLLDQFLGLPKNVFDGPPVVLSPIFWFHTGHWYGDAVSSKRVWRALEKGLGGARARKFYEAWQRIKFTYGAQGQKNRADISVPDHLLPNSEAEIDYLQSALGIREEIRSRCTIVPNGVNRDLYDPPPSPNEEFRREYGLRNFVLQVGRIQSAKNQLGAIEALFDTSLPIVFVGQPSPYEPEYVSRCQIVAKQRGNVYFIGPKSPEELAGIYVLASVHVLPSWRETPGLASIEAAAAGCRVVSTSIGSAGEYFGDDAWYCDPRDPESIKKAVLDALSSQPSERLRSKVLRNYTWDVAAGITLEAYRKVTTRVRLKNSGRPGST
jgi:glycosyltransferase involved in cell wall biosynthesis